MARMRPELSDEQVQEFGSEAERILYRTIRKELSNDVLAIHSLSWTYHKHHQGVIEGEADFILFFPAAGFLTIEVKGGGISLDAVTGAWCSVDRHGTRHAIKDPFRQAKKERFAVLDQLKGHIDWRKWRGTRVLAGHSVFFPNVREARPLQGPDRPPQIIGVQADLANFSAWIERVLAFWRSGTDSQELGKAGVALAESILCKSIEVRPPLASALDAEERIRIRLTSQQARVLRVLGGRLRAIISGGAGTGKTLIAAEKARSLATHGRSVLFVCYNRPLADAIRSGMKDVPNVSVMTFHQLCEIRVSAVRTATGRDLFSEAAAAYPRGNRFDVQMPFALALAGEVLTEKYDAIIVDEAQDFSEDYWLAIEDLLSDPEQGSLYVFTDPNQAVYKRRAQLPVQDEPFYLTTNCRNTAHIHKAAYRFFEGETTDPPEIDGSPIAQITASSLVEQAAAIARAVSLLVTSEQVRPEHIAVLVLSRSKDQYYEALARTTGSWAFEISQSGKVFVDTVARFKGLEAAVVFLWFPPNINEEEEREALYVGLSRAKSRLFVVGRVDWIDCAGALRTQDRT
jgi:hypothetical protein